MIGDENPYRAPEAPIVGRAAYQPRPILSFLAGASCIGASVPFLIAGVLWARLPFLSVPAEGWIALTNRREMLGMAAGSLCGGCVVALLVAGRSFLIRKGRRGRRALLAFAASFFGLVALIQVFQL